MKLGESMLSKQVSGRLLAAGTPVTPYSAGSRVQGSCAMV